MSEIINASGFYSELKALIDPVRTNPTEIQTTILNYLEQITNGEIDLVDPTNPFIFLLEASSVTASSIMDGYIDGIRKQYPRLSTTYDDLYHHMSDIDYIGRFSIPAKANITFVLFRNDIVTKGVYNSTEQAHTFIIPRYTKCIVHDIPFMILHPIIVKEYDNGSIVVTRDLSVENPLDYGTRAVVPYTINKVNENESWVYFTVPGVQVDISSNEFIINNGSNFKQNISYLDNFVYAEAHGYDGTNWNKLKTTHSDLVYDVTDPTVLFKVTENVLEVKIPPAYLTPNTIGQLLRIDLYNSKGKISMELGELPIKDWSRKVVVVDSVRDSSPETAATNTVTLGTFSYDRVDGGRNMLSYEELRTRLFQNVLGPMNQPITLFQIQEYVNRDGYDIVEGIDIISSRKYMGLKDLPQPEIIGVSTGSITTIASVGITDRDIVNVDDLGITSLDTDLSKRIIYHNNNRYSILNDTIFIEENDIIKPMTKAEYDAIIALPKEERVTSLKDKNYWYNPFYYILHRDANELTTKVYDLDEPNINFVNWINRNENSTAVVSTASYSIEKTNTSYIIRITTISDDNYKNASDREAQLVYTNKGGGKSYINSSSTSTTPDNEFIFEFILNINHDITKDDEIIFTNMYVGSSVANSNEIPIHATLSLYYTTTDPSVVTSGSSMDSEIGSAILPIGSRAIVREDLDITFGEHLEWLWKRSKLYYHETIYKRYLTDVYATYSRDIYDRDPITGAIFTVSSTCNSVTYLKIHNKGDPILDDDGNPILLHSAGDVVLNASGDPIVDYTKGISMEMDLILSEAVFHFATSTPYKKYKNKIKHVIKERVLKDMTRFNEDTIEKTEILYGSKKTHGSIYTKINGVSTKSNSRKKFRIIIYVADTILIDDSVRESISDKIIAAIDRNTANGVIDMEEIRFIINEVGAISKGIEIYLDDNKFTGTMESEKKGERFAIKRQPILTQDGEISVTTDVDIKYITVIS